jgi:hypothetical protein
MFKGFKPALSKPVPGKDQTVNLNPEIVIVNSPLTFGKDNRPLNGQKIFTSLNIAFMPAVQDFFHCFGEQLTVDDENESVDIPGSFSNGTSDPNPALWGQYQGNIVNAIGRIEIVETQANKKENGQWVPDPTKTRSEIKRYFCNVPGCQTIHLESLIRS